MNPAALLALSSPADFARLCSRVPWQTTPHQTLVADAIADAVYANKLSILLVEMPPQHGKSAIVSQWTPAWYLSLRPERLVAVCAYEAGVAARWGEWVRDTLRELRAVPISASSQAKDDWRTTRGGGMITAGVGGPLTSYGIHLLIVDDPFKNAEEADSEVMRNKVWDWFQTVAWTRKQPGTVIVIMHTRWHEDDLVGRILAHREMAPLVRRIRFPAICEDDDDALGRVQGEALWPSRFPADASPDGLLTTKAVLSPRWWNALYQQRPTAAEGAEVKRHWWRWYEELPVARDRLDCVIASWDCAFRDSDGSDYVAGTVWGVYGSYRYLLDMVRARLDFVATCGAVTALSDKWRPNATLIEAKANGDAVINTLQSMVPGIVPIEPHGGKEARVRACSPQIEAGNVYLPRTTWAHELVEEAAAFPLGKNDDMIDSTAQALNYLLHHQQDHVTDLQAGDNSFVPPHILALRERGVLGSAQHWKGRL